MERRFARERRDGFDRNRRDESDPRARTIIGFVRVDPDDIPDSAEDQERGNEGTRARVRLEDEQRRRMLDYEDRRRWTLAEQDRRDRVDGDLRDRDRYEQDDRDRRAEVDHDDRVRAELDRRDQAADRDRRYRTRADLERDRVSGEIDSQD